MRWEGTYPPEEKCCSAARHACADGLCDAGVSAELFEIVVLVLGELVANAVRHACTDFTAAIELSPTWLRVEVFDAGARPPVLVRAGSHATSGRGLNIVSELSTDWGWDAGPRDGVKGKTVWAGFALEHHGTAI